MHGIPDVIALLSFIVLVLILVDIVTGRIPPYVWGLFVALVLVLEHGLPFLLRK